MLVQFDFGAARIKSWHKKSQCYILFLRIKGINEVFRPYYAPKAGDTIAYDDRLVAFVVSTSSSPAYEGRSVTNRSPFRYITI